jgi:hypothetical protein
MSDLQIEAAATIDDLRIAAMLMRDMDLPITQHIIEQAIDLIQLLSGLEQEQDAYGDWLEAALP